MTDVRRRRQGRRGLPALPDPLVVEFGSGPDGSVMLDVGPLVEAIAQRVEQRVARLLEAERTTAARATDALTVAEAAEALRVSDDTVARLIRNGELASLKVGSRRVIPRSAIDTYLQGNGG